MRAINIQVTLFLVLCAVTHGQYPINFDSFPIGEAGNGTIWYQTSGFFTFQNVKNPIQVQISYAQNTENTLASLCLNSYAASYPVSGVDLQISCPTGAYGTAANATEETLTPAPLYQAKFGLSKSSRFMQARMIMADDSDFNPEDTFYAEIFVKPTKGAGFVVTLPDQVDLQTFQLFLSGQQCDAGTYPVGPNYECVPILSLPQSINLTLTANQWIFYQLNFATFDTTHANSLEVTINGTNNGINMWVQQNYYPTPNWFLNPDKKTNGGSSTYTIWLPGMPDGETFYFGIHNTADKTQVVQLNSVLTTCQAGNLFGNACSYNSQISNNPLQGYLALNATISTRAQTSDGKVNNGTAWQFDYSDSSSDMAYFSIYSYPKGPLLPVPYYIRVTVAANDGGDAPAFFAKKGGFPSEQSNHYNMSSTGDVSHQIVIRITQEDLDNQSDPENVWYFGVRLPADFSIWVGTNCANNCSDGKHGLCYCNGEPCMEATNNGANPAAFYSLPSSTLDSAGACYCDDDDYSNSFDCSSKNSRSALWWLLILPVTFGVFIVVIAVGVIGFSVYLRHRRRAGYAVVD